MEICDLGVQIKVFEGKKEIKLILKNDKKQNSQFIYLDMEPPAPPAAALYK